MLYLLLMRIPRQWVSELMLPFREGAGLHILSHPSHLAYPSSYTLIIYGEG